MSDLEIASLTKPERAAGYTLAEMAICLCIVGLLMSGGMAGASRFFEAQKNAQTRRNIDLAANVLSSYAQTHYRLPCPADPQAAPDQAGREKCPAARDGILPWKELAIPRGMAADAWAHYFTYSPAPRLTANTLSASVAVNNACRSASWFDADGNNLNRARAQFCCGGQPDIEGEPDMVAAAEAANAIEPAAGNGAGSRQDRISVPHYMEGPALPLLGSAVPAVTLSAKGVSLSLRAEQLFARAGSGSCAAPSASASRPYSCMRQNFRSGGGVQEIKDPATGKTITTPPLYGVDLALAGDKYQLRGSLTNSSAESAWDNSVGFYVINSDGGIGGVQMLVPSVKSWPKGETVNFTLPADRSVIGIGLFIVPDGFTKMAGYKHADLTKLKFVSGDINRRGERASIADQVPPVLVSVDPATGAEVTVRGREGVSAYHLYSNLNPGRIGHTLRADSICRMAGERVGPNHDFTCRRPTAIDEAGINPARPALAQIGFEERGDIDCYEARDGHCRGASPSGKDLIGDGAGGYVASIGDNSYDDVAFSIGLTACPQKQ